MKQSISLEKVAFFFFVFVAIFFLWLPKYPPMVDIPQHAAQVSALKSILEKNFAFQDLVELNFVTPYWLAYGSWFLLAQFFSIHTALKIILTITFIAYVGMFVYLRKELLAPGILDWIIIPTFFGYSYEWGFLTFLISIPLGLFFFILNMRWEEKGSIKYGILVLVMGIVLFLSHLLVFLFFCFLSALYLAVSKKFSLSDVPNFIWPYLIFLVLLILYFSRIDSLTGLYSYNINSYYYGTLADRFINIMLIPWGIEPNIWATMTLSYVALFIPFLLGYQLKKELKSWVPLLSFLIMWFSLPHFFHNTFFIYQRFSIFFFPFYIFIFSNDEKEENYSCRKKFRYKLGIVLGCLVFLGLFTKPIINLWKFDKEVSSFGRLLQKLPKHKRALSRVLDTEGSLIQNKRIFVHFPLLYQVEREGWVDFNFAWFHPQVVRFLPDKVPDAKPSFEWGTTPISELTDLNKYQLIFTRVATEPNINIFKGCSITPVPYINDGKWYIYKIPINSRRN